MSEGLLIGITQALDEEFGSDISVYTDEMEQGIETPCFLVTDLISTEEQILGNRYKRSYPFMVQYFPKERQYRLECDKVKDRLFNCLEYIMADENRTRGTDMSGRIVDGILNFEVTYNMQIFKDRRDRTEIMENLATSQDVKE